MYFAIMDDNGAYYCGHSDFSVHICNAKFYDTEEKAYKTISELCWIKRAFHVVQVEILELYKQPSEIATNVLVAGV